MMEDFNFDKLGNSSDHPLKELVEKVQYDTFTQAYKCIEEMGYEFLIVKGSKKPLKILKGLIEYFQHPDREEYEKCAILLKAAKSYRDDKKELDKLKKSSK